MILSKTLDPVDFALLTPELEIVDRHFTKAREQHPMRRWEYAMALRALGRWTDLHGHHAANILDVGGAGSPFRYMQLYDGHVSVIDPEEPPPNNCALEQFVTAGAELSDAVFCLSVLEHVPDVEQFLYLLSCLVAPGGLLFLTMDYCGGVCKADSWPPDNYHFHWMRRRIFNVYRWGWLRRLLHARDFDLLDGEMDGAYHGPQVYDYTFASLAMVKRS